MSTRYLHFPIVAGIVLFAFALKTTLADVDGELATIPALGLCGGPRPVPVSPSWRSACACHARSAAGRPGRRRLRCALLWPVALVVPALVALTLAALCLGADFTPTKSSGGAKPAHRRARSECQLHDESDGSRSEGARAADRVCCHRCAPERPGMFPERSVRDGPGMHDRTQPTIPLAQTLAHLRLTSADLT